MTKPQEIFRGSHHTSENLLRREDSWKEMCKSREHISVSSPLSLILPAQVRRGIREPCCDLGQYLPECKTASYFLLRSLMSCRKPHPHLRLEQSTGDFSGVWKWMETGPWHKVGWPWRAETDWSALDGWMRIDSIIEKSLKIQSLTE